MVSLFPQKHPLKRAGLKAVINLVVSAASLAAWDLQGAPGGRLGTGGGLTGLPCKSQAVREAAVTANFIRASKAAD